MKLGNNLCVVFALLIVSINSTIFSQEGAKAPLGEKFEAVDTSDKSSTLKSGGPGGPPIGGDDTTGVTDNEQNHLVISCNNGNLFVSSEKGIEEINIFNIIGKLSFNEMTYKTLVYQNYINVPSGIYVIIIEFSDGSTQTKKIKIQ